MICSYYFCICKIDITFRLSLTYPIWFYDKDLSVQFFLCGEYLIPVNCEKKLFLFIIFWGWCCLWLLFNRILMNCNQVFDVGFIQDLTLFHTNILPSVRLFSSFIFFLYFLRLIFPSSGYNQDYNRGRRIMLTFILRSIRAGMCSRLNKISISSMFKNKRNKSVIEIIKKDPQSYIWSWYHQPRSAIT